MAGNYSAVAGTFTRKPSKAELEHDQVMARYDLLGRGIDIVRIAVTILCYAPLLWLILQMVEEVAGKDTNFNFTMQLSVAFAVAEAIGLVAQERRIRREKRDLVALRSRAKRLEGALIQAGIPAPKEGS